MRFNLRSLSPKSWLPSKKPNVQEVDVLVHPFHSHPTALSEADVSQRMEMWKKRIDWLAKRNGHYLAVESSGSTYHDPRAFDNLVGYARQKLGENRVLVFNPNSNGRLQSVPFDLEKELSRIGYDSDKLKVHFYGEYADLCVTTWFHLTVPTLMPRHRIEKNSRILLQYTAVAPSRILSVAELKKGGGKRARTEIRDRLNILKGNR